MYSSTHVESRLQICSARRVWVYKKYVLHVPTILTQKWRISDNWSWDIIDAIFIFNLFGMIYRNPVLDVYVPSTCCYLLQSCYGFAHTISLTNLCLSIKVRNFAMVCQSSNSCSHLSSRSFLEVLSRALFLAQWNFPLMKNRFIHHCWSTVLYIASYCFFWHDHL